MTARWEQRWKEWQPSPESGHPAERGGCTEDAAYDAGLTPEPQGWTTRADQPDPRLDPDSDRYDPGYDAARAFEEPGPESLRQMQACQGWTCRRPAAGKEPPGWDIEAGA